jgi:hypothetical protein
MDTQQVRGELDVAAASISGRAIALVEPVPGTAPGVPVPRAETTIVVADPVGGGEAMRYLLDGNYEPEAFSIDDGDVPDRSAGRDPGVHRVVVLGWPPASAARARAVQDRRNGCPVPPGVDRSRRRCTLYSN